MPADRGAAGSTGFGPNPNGEEDAPTIALPEGPSVRMVRPRDSRGPVSGDRTAIPEARDFDGTARAAAPVSPILLRDRERTVTDLAILAGGRLPRGGLL